MVAITARPLLDRVQHWYSKTAGQPPALARFTVVTFSVLYVLIYVIPFYLSDTTRPSPKLSRDAPTVIRARIRAVTFSCIVTCAATTYIAHKDARLNMYEILHLYGWWPLYGPDLVRSLLLVAILFAGPLFESAIIQGQWRSWIRGGSLFETLFSTIGFRNYVAGPITEEFVFRSMIVPLHLLAKESPARLVFVTPLYFGIAHIHHCYEFKLTHPQVPLLPAILRSLFQFSYTSLFGFYAAFLFLRTGSLPAAILAHSFCNWMGLPRFWGRVEAPVPMGPPDTSRKDDLSDVQGSPAVRSRNGGLHLGWTIAYYLVLVAGAVGFYQNLWRLTESPNASIRKWTS